MNIVKLEDIAGIILAAGRGERLMPITESLPKPLVRIDKGTLLDAAIGSMPLPERAIAVNSYYLADQIVGHLKDSPIHVEVETEPLGSGGAVSNLRYWVDGRHVMVRNADMWFDRVPTELWTGWTGKNPRLLVQATGVPSDFGTARFLGWSMLPWGMVSALPTGRSALLDEVWRPAFEQGNLELVYFDGISIDAGTPADLEILRRSLEAAGPGSER